MDETGRLRASDLTSAQSSAGRAVDLSVAYSFFAAIGALVAAIAPAIMASIDTTTVTGEAGDLSEVIQLRGSISAYWDVDPKHAYWLPFTVAAVLLLVDATLSVTSSNRHIYGKRYQNFFLGVSLLLLVWFNKDDDPWVHYPATYLFFILFAVAMAYGGLLGYSGRQVEGVEAAGNRQAEKANGIVSLIFVSLLFLAFTFRYPLDWISHYYFETYALISFAFHYVLNAVNPFPYNYYEFRHDWLNAVLRQLRIMKSRPEMGSS